MGTNKQPNIYVNPQSTTKKSVATELNISEWLYLSFGSAEGKVEINGKRKQKGVASLVLTVCLVGLLGPTRMGSTRFFVVWIGVG